MIIFTSLISIGLLTHGKKHQVESLVNEFSAYLFSGHDEEFDFAFDTLHSLKSISGENVICASSIMASLLYEFLYERIERMERIIALLAAMAFQVRAFQCYQL